MATEVHSGAHRRPRVVLIAHASHGQKPHPTATTPAPKSQIKPGSSVVRASSPYFQCAPGDKLH